MMKKIVLICFVLFYGLWANAGSKDMVLKVELVRLSKEPVSIEVNDQKYRLSFAEGKLSDQIVCKDVKSGYANLSIGNFQKILFVEPGKDLTIKIIPTDLPWEKDFEFQGKTAAINTYLVKSNLKLIQSEDFRLEPEEFIKKQQRYTAENIKALRSHRFDSDFNKWEEIRIKYLVHSHATRYLTQHFWEKPTEMSGLEEYTDLPEVKAYIRSLIVDDITYWNVGSYRNFCVSAVSALSRESDFFGGDFQESTLKRCEYVLKNFKDKALVERLIYRFLEIYLIREEGKPLGGALERYFTAYVKTPELIQSFDEQRQKWAKIQQGGEFMEEGAYVDANGAPVAISSLKGKYVYIDVWATWCGPCCAEIPDLKKLETKFHDKNIQFVSISVDHSKAAWLKKITDDEMTGIQLYGGPKAAVMKEFRIDGIPRFILLDRDGRVLDAEMSRPSNPKTVERLNALEGI